MLSPFRHEFFKIEIFQNLWCFLDQNTSENKICESWQKKTLPESSYSIYCIWDLDGQRLYTYIYLMYMNVYSYMYMYIYTNIIFTVYIYLSIYDLYTYVCAWICIYVYIILDVCICIWKINRNSIRLDFLVYSTWLNSSRIWGKSHIGPLNSIC